jgi:transcriptional regulator with XRE-family HTH domain
MELSQPEIIQILRRRSGMNQGDFGARAFSTSFESGRTKVKNIELGKQIPTETDLVNMARVLKTDAKNLKPDAFRSANKIPKDATVIDAKVLRLFPGLATYLDMLNKAAILEDSELIEYIAGKIASLFSGEATMLAAGGDH